MKDLTKQLISELQQDLHIDIKHHQHWNLPVQLLKVDFETVQQSKMDVLMKMLLTAFQTSKFQNSRQLSDILQVEPLFIEHVRQKMERANLIKKNEQVYMLTEKGEAQLTSEVFVDLPEDQTMHLLFSPCHERYSLGEIEKGQEELADYRYYDDFSDWDVEALDEKGMREILQNRFKVEEANQIQIVVSAIQSIVPLTIEIIPCIEFQLYNKETDVFYARIWNTLLNEWDKTLEGQVNEREREVWRKTFSLDDQ